jgi:hypothetical protein
MIAKKDKIFDTNEKNNSKTISFQTIILLNIKSDY